MDISNLLSEIDSARHLDILLLLGISVFAGTIGAKLFQKLRIPQVVGYIAMGIIIGASGFNVINPSIIKTLAPFNMFALGIIGFMIGSELKTEIFKKYGKQFFAILFAEGISAFLIVTVSTIAVGQMFLHNWHSSVALGLILGAIASATAPAATVDVLWEYKTRGMLTRTILAIVALDDGLALLLYGFAASIAGALMGAGQTSLLSSLLTPLWEIIGSIMLGTALGAVLVNILKYIKDSDKVLAFSIAAIMLAMGLSVTFKVESILTAMVLGAVLANLQPVRSQATVKQVEKFSPPIYVLFFVLVGARLEFSSIPFWVAVLALVYVVGRTAGKIFGSWFGARISHSAVSVRKYLGICLFSQAGVAIGLSIIASQRFDNEMGHAVILIITATTFFVQIIGPPMVKLGVKKAGEVGLNVTEEDLIRTYTIDDVMVKELPTIFEGTLLTKIISIFGKTNSFYYPVVDNSKKLIGEITLDSIRNTFATSEANEWLVALDIMNPPVSKITPEISLEDATEKMKKLNIDYLPVISGKTEEFLGVLDYRSLNRQLSAEVLERQQKADAGQITG